MSHTLHTLARRILDRRDPLPDEVLAAARRTVANVVATAVGAAGAPAVDAVVAASTAMAPGGTAVVPGRPERLHPLDAALATGLAAHLDDFDDTHLRTVIHPGAVELATLVALQDGQATRDADEVLTAVSWGVEAQLRLGNAISPEHYDAGWHITGTCGPVGAAVTAGLLRGLDVDRLAVATALAAGGPVGNREGFGSMTKPFHPGQAAVVGLRAVQAAVDDAPWPGDVLTGPSGLATRLAAGVFRPGELLDDLGTRWELCANTFKPYPCGIVTHPAIEAAEALHAGLPAGDTRVIEEVELVCHPLVPELTGNTDPADGLQARFSTAHGIAAGLLLGQVGLPAYDDDLVHRDEAARLRSLVRFSAGDGCARDAARLRIRIGDEWRHHDVVHVRGSLARPMTDDDLAAKARALVEPTLPGRAAELGRACRATGPGWVPALLAATVPDRALPRRAPESAVPVSGADAALAELVAHGAVRPGPRGAELLGHLAGRGRSALDDAPHEPDPRRRAMLVTRALGNGHDPAVVAAVAAALACGDGTDAMAPAAAAGVALDLARTLAVPSAAVVRVAAALAAAAAAGAPPRTVLHALGLAATQVTGVAGDSASDVLRASAQADAVLDGVAAARLAAAGVTGPAQPLHGRRGLVSLLGVGDARRRVTTAETASAALEEAAPVVAL
ncbi:MmgE/PrpD family protein [Pseudonocardia sp. ICBG1293]|uniref:MmgE/PrpD family protein n=1 Tax=Pseudonocardia sp. ICBG1293 TaxID=2844382 RepID=UPI001CCAF4D6|nr:MmgE/PrpD family protein [Pseudonocardia sp. ICBG1293]